VQYHLEVFAVSKKALYETPVIRFVGSFSAVTGFRPSGFFDGIVVGGKF
jgi:hypothetical protein